ncbi:MAG: hypothetical protein II041_04085 [Bacteroidales bacterium]|nr:hypothetical protein [Bacteroidales bacterium]
MKKFIAISILALLLAAGPATAQTSSGIDSILQNKPLTEEDLLKMYGADTNVHFQKMQAEMEKVEQQASQTEAQDKLRRQIALIFSLLIAIFPAISLFRLVRKKKVEVKDKSNIPSAVLVLLPGGIVLFAFNYFMIWMSLKHGTSFHAAIAIIAMAVLTAWAIWEYFRKPKDKSQK